MHQHSGLVEFGTWFTFTLCGTLLAQQHLCFWQCAATRRVALAVTIRCTRNKTITSRGELVRREKQVFSRVPDMRHKVVVKLDAAPKTLFLALRTIIGETHFESHAGKPIFLEYEGINRLGKIAGVVKVNALVPFGRSKATLANRRECLSVDKFT